MSSSYRPAMVNYRVADLNSFCRTGSPALSTAITIRSPFVTTLRSLTTPSVGLESALSLSDLSEKVSAVQPG
jgi:hypothetical protein